jgi:hypothetical protein
MNFNYAYPSSKKQGGACFSLARIGCIIGCILIAAFGHIDDERFGLLPIDSNQGSGFSQATGSGPGCLTSNNSAMPTDVFLVSEKKKKPVPLLLACHELTACANAGFFQPYIARAHIRMSARFYQRSNIYTTPLLPSTPLRC